MKHSKRARTRFLVRQALRSRSLFGKTAKRSNWEHKTAADVLADVNAMLTDSASITAHMQGSAEFDAWANEIAEEQP